MIQVTRPPTYPARPFNGGGLDSVRRGWTYTPKLNGWRVVVHTPTGRCFNRQNGLLSIVPELLEATQKLQAIIPYEWVDCEALERRHDMGKGSLFVLDIITKQDTAAKRHAMIQEYVPEFSVGDEDKLQPNSLYCLHEYTPMQVPDMWNQMFQYNELKHSEFYEGVVGKLPYTTYPQQLMSPDRIAESWVKHKFPQPLTKNWNASFRKK
jgi:hypothetical protein